MSEEAIKKLQGRSYYKTAFTTQSGEKVLLDLANFCRFMHEPLPVSTLDAKVDPYALAYLAGQRSVYVHILNMSNYPHEKVAKKLMDSKHEQEE